MACALDDALTVIDIAGQEGRSARIDLGGPREITQARRGERLFNSASIAFRRQLSCHTCHPDGHVDGLTYDIEADGIGLAPVDNRTLRGILDTGPFKWDGHQRYAVAPVRSAALGLLHPDPAVHARRARRRRSLHQHHSEAAESLSPAGRRADAGPAAGQGDVRADHHERRPADPQAAAVRVVPLPALCTPTVRSTTWARRWSWTSTRRWTCPHLNNIYDSAPYLHNGIADTLEEIWTRFNPEDRHGVTNDMTKDQLNDLIEYLKTL